MSASRLTSWLFGLASAATLSACCSEGTCIKPPPCRPCENPCCLSPVQKATLKKGDHALPGPMAYSWNGKTYVLFGEKGQKEFQKDPTSFEEKGAIRLISDYGTIRVDVDPGDGYDFGPAVSSAQPYAPPPK